MDRLRRIRCKYAIVLGPVLAAGLAALAVAPGGWQPYAPSAILPDVCSNLGLSSAEPEIRTAFLGDERPPVPSIFDFAYPVSPLRDVTVSRSSPTRAMFDWRLFRDELASHEVELRSGPDEMVNIELAARAIDGVVVRPFEIFSFNATVGERSDERGFRPGLMFASGEVVTGLGGGVCIASTALYNAVLKAGYKIIERTHHSGPVRYAEPGLDSAVVYGVIDLRFKNDTISPVLIRSRVDDGRLVVSLRGRKRPGFEVEIVGKDFAELPYKIIETEDPVVSAVEVKVPARMGFEVTTVRVFKQGGKVLKSEIVSHDVVPARDKVVLTPPKPQTDVLLDEVVEDQRGPGLPQPDSIECVPEADPGQTTEDDRQSDRPQPDR